MQHAAGSGTAVEFCDQDGAYRWVVADLASLMDRIHASLELLERAIAFEMSTGKEDISADIVVLDDITPAYAKASAALGARGASLGLALHMLRGLMIAGVRGEAAAGTREPSSAARA